MATADFPDLDGTPLETVFWVDPGEPSWLVMRLLAEGVERTIQVLPVLSEGGEEGRSWLVVPRTAWAAPKNKRLIPDDFVETFKLGTVICSVDGDLGTILTGSRVSFSVLLCTPEVYGALEQVDLPSFDAAEIYFSDTADIAHLPLRSEIEAVIREADAARFVSAGSALRSRVQRGRGMGSGRGSAAARGGSHPGASDEVPAQIARLQAEIDSLTARFGQPHRVGGPPPGLGRGGRAGPGVAADRPAVPIGGLASGLPAHRVGQDPGPSPITPLLAQQARDAGISELDLNLFASLLAKAPATVPVARRLRGAQAPQSAAAGADDPLGGGGLLGESEEDGAGPGELGPSAGGVPTPPGDPVAASLVQLAKIVTDLASGRRGQTAAEEQAQGYAA